MAVLTMRDIHKLKRWNPYKIDRNWTNLVDMGRFSNNVVNLGPYDGIRNYWKDEPCVIVGAGPSLKGFEFSKLNGIHTIGINHVVEDYDGFEFLLFLDNRFINKTTYNISKFKGKIFQSNQTQILPDNDTVRFKKKGFKVSPTLRIEDGLFNAASSGLCALNLALITGANPIYLIGLDYTGNDHNDYHYKQNYTGAIHSQKQLNKYIGNAGYFNYFSQWKDRIINLSSISNINTFKKEDINNIDWNSLKKRKSTEKTICHMITFETMDRMGDISRQIFDMSYGKHIFCNINNPPPKADIYLLECFINGAEKYKNFQKPKGSKVISLIHSSSKCQPALCSDKVVTITNSWKEITKRKYGFNSEMIYAGIDLSLYTELPDYTKKTFGRITRWSPGKVHIEFNHIAKRILEKNPDSYCIMYTGRHKSQLQHERIIIDDSIRINESEKKAKKLRELTIFADMHNTFIETFSLCLLEAMSAGLCCLMYSEAPQPAMREILGNAGIWCKTTKEFEGLLHELLNDPVRKREYGLKAKERAKEFTIDKMINKYNKLFRSL